MTFFPATFAVKHPHVPPPTSSMEEMAARRGPEEQLPEVEPSQVGEAARPQQGYISTKTKGKWKKASYFLAAVALLLLIGLATLLGIFLSR